MSQLTIDALQENLPAVSAFVEEALEAMDCPMRVQMAVSVAVEEIFINIASYAYPSGTGSAEIVLMPAEGRSGVMITFTDSGIPYNPLARLDPDTTLSAEERQIGGLGIFMVKKSMDGMTYRRDGGRNILTITKYF